MSEVPTSQPPIGEFPRSCRVVIHLRSGGTIEGLYNDVTEAEFKEIKRDTADLLSSSDGWQVNLETAYGWVVAPKDSVDYLSVDFGGSQ